MKYICLGYYDKVNTKPLPRARQQAIFDLL